MKERDREWEREGDEQERESERNGEIEPNRFGQTYFSLSNCKAIIIFCCTIFTAHTALKPAFLATSFTHSCFKISGLNETEWIQVKKEEKDHQVKSEKQFQNISVYKCRSVFSLPTILRLHI